MKRIPVRAGLLLTLALALVAASGCSPWTIVKQANPNPLAGQKALVAEPLHFESMKVGSKTEAEYLAGKDGKQQESWKADLASMTQLFADNLARQAKGVQITAGSAGPLVVRPIVTMIEVGNFNGVFNIPTDVMVTLQIVDDKGTVLDDINYKITVAADLIRPSVGQRLRTAAELAAARAASYIQTRAGGK
jgi:uncharacterized lipoprotein YmbA